MAAPGHGISGAGGYIHLMDELSFRKSTYSSTARDCVEVADLPAGAAVRDTQHRHEGHIAFGAAEWRALLDGVRAPR